MGLFRREKARRLALPDPLTVPQGAVAALFALQRRDLRRGDDLEVPAGASAWLVWGEAFRQLHAGRHPRAELREFLESGGRASRRGEPALLLLCREAELPGGILTLAPAYVPLLVKSLESREGKLSVAEASDRLKTAGEESFEALGLRAHFVAAPESHARSAGARSPGPLLRQSDRDALAAAKRENEMLEVASARLEPESANLIPRTKAARSLFQRAPRFVIVTNLQAIEKKYGRKGARGLTGLVQDFHESVQKSGAADESVLIDLGKRPDLARRPDHIKEHVDALLSKSAAASGPDILQIVGGHDIVPHWAFRNPAHEMGDPDEILLTDNPYADDDASDGLTTALLPERMIARIPDERTASAEDFAQLLDRLFGGDADIPPPPAPDSGQAFGIVAAAFPTGDKVFERMAGALGGLNISPPWSAEVFNAERFAQAAWHYYLVHGSDVWPEWYGDSGMGQYPVALRPDQVLGCRLRSEATVLTEACFGAYTPGKNAEEALSLAFLRAGARRLLGSLNTAWTILTEQLFTDALDILLAGGGLAEALWTSRIRLLSHYREADPLAQKTLSNFVVYGNAAELLPRFEDAREEWQVVFEEASEHRRAVATGRVLTLAAPLLEGSRATTDGFRRLAREAMEHFALRGYEREPEPVACVRAPFRGNEEVSYVYRAETPGRDARPGRIALIRLAPDGTPIAANEMS